MLAEDLLVEFNDAVMPAGRISRTAYKHFIGIVESVESQFFGPSWILRKPPRRF